MTDLFTRRRDIANCPSTKQSHLGKCNNGKLRTSTLVNDGILRRTVDFASALSNVKMLIMLKMLKYLICLYAEAYTSSKLQDYENIHGVDSFLIT